MGRGGGDSDKRGAWEAASIVFRIATVGLSLASAIMTVASTQCAQSNGCPAGAGAGTVSYSDFNSFEYSALADLLSAVLQGVAIYLEVVGKEKAAKFVELIDKLVMALTASSASLLLAVDDITSCGPPRGPARGRRQRSLCNQAGELCGKVRRSSAFSFVATVSVSATVYIRHVHMRVARPCRLPQTPSPRTPSSPSTPQTDSAAAGAFALAAAVSIDSSLLREPADDPMRLREPAAVPVFDDPSWRLREPAAAVLRVPEADDPVQLRNLELFGGFFF